jgi:hypothetical protein
MRVLWRAFFDQLFTSESVTSDVHLRQALIGVLAFLLPPGLFLLVEVIPLYALVATHFPEMLNALLLRLAFVFVTYSMVTIGFVAVFVWDALTFDRRDAMVLGPLPVSAGTIMLAKLGALAVFLVGSSGAVNLFTAVPFALITADRMGATTFAVYFGAHLAATMSAATFVFASLVAIRGLVAMASGARFAARVGALLQFVCVAAVLSFVIVMPQALKINRVSMGSMAVAPWLPSAWFLGLFEVVRGSAQADMAVLAQRGVVALTLAVAGAIAASVLAVRHQLRAALAPSAFAGPLGSAKVSRLAVRLFTGSGGRARAIADFILTTIARSRSQQAPIAIAAAVGFAVALAGLSRGSADVSSLMHPRTIVLWTPLVIGFWIAIGVRQSFFVPSEPLAAWTFRSNGSGDPVATWSAVRASMLVIVAAPAFLIACSLSSLIGWRLAFMHAWISCAALAVLVEALALTVRHVPFTRPYPPGHARLKTRWPLYLLGMYAVAYLPVQLELDLLRRGAPLLVMGVCITVTVTLLDVIGRHAARRLTEPPKIPTRTFPARPCSTSAAHCRATRAADF